MDSEATERYALAHFVYAARTRDGVVLLDLKRDQYFGVAGREDTICTRLVRGWPAPLRELALESELDVEPGTGGVSAQLLATGMLVVQHPEAEDPFPSRTTLLAQDLVSVGDELRPDVRIRLQDILNFALAYAYARLSLRWRHISAVAADVRKSRERISTSFDHTATSYYVAVFRRLRPYFFTADGQCLFHALCLVLFLRRHGIVPTWVIGVKTGQWQAHSWVQEGPYLLDTNPEKVCEFTPILGI